MAKPTLTFLLFVFFVVSVSHARQLTERSEHEVSVSDSASGSIDDSDLKASIFLPSEKLSEYDAPKSMSVLNQVRTEDNPSEISAVDATESVSDPVVVLTFRPINRQFDRRTVPLIFRRSRRGCHRRHNFKPYSVGRISYGNDMIVADERQSPNSVVNWGSDREIAIPSRWREIRHDEPRESFRSDSKDDRKHLHFLHQRAEEKEQEHKEKNGFLRNFRKFLNQFEF